jgi:hypothetical protein
VKEAALGELTHLTETIGRLSTAGARDIIAIYFEDMRSWLKRNEGHSDPIRGFWSTIHPEGE